MHKVCVKIDLQWPQTLPITLFIREIMKDQEENDASKMTCSGLNVFPKLAWKKEFASTLRTY